MKKSMLALAMTLSLSALAPAVSWAASGAAEGGSDIVEITDSNLSDGAADSMGSGDGSMPAGMTSGESSAPAPAPQAEPDPAPAPAPQAAPDPAPAASLETLETPAPAPVAAPAPEAADAPAANQGGSGSSGNRRANKPQTPLNLKNPKYGSYYAPSCSPVVPKLDKEVAKYKKLVEKYDKDAQKVIEKADLKLQKLQEQAFKRSQDITASADERKRLQLDQLVLQTKRREMQQLKGKGTEADFDLFKSRMDAIDDAHAKEALRADQVQSRADLLSKSIVEKAAIDAEQLKTKAENAKALIERAEAAKEYYKRVKCVDRGATAKATYRRYVRRGRWGGGRTWAGTRRTKPVINYFSDVEHVTQDVRRLEDEIEVRRALGQYGQVVRNVNLKREKENQKRRLEREVFHVH